MYSKKSQLDKQSQKSKQKRCKEPTCRKWFTPKTDSQILCSDICTELFSHTIATKAQNKLNKIKKQEANKSKKELNENDKSWLISKAQQLFNKYIRLRDKDQPCISCGNIDRQMHAGHYRPVGRNGQHRFNEDNCHSQCSICNNYMSGNLNSYRAGLIFKIGEKRVVALENQNTPKQWEVEELKNIIKKYKQKIKDMVE